MKTKYYHIQNIDYEEIAKLIKENKIGVFPTETVYGIGANAKSDEAIQKIYDLKKRDANKALIVLISSIDMLDPIGLEVNALEKKLMHKFWPGALTIILSINSQFNLSPLVLGGGSTVAIRYTSKELLQKIISLANTPIVAPSANMQGNKTGTNPLEIKKDFEGKIAYFIDEGIIANDVPSTLVKVNNQKVQVLREGLITKEMLQKEGFQLDSY